MTYLWYSLEAVHGVMVEGYEAVDYCRYQTIDDTLYRPCNTDWHKTTTYVVWNACLLRPSRKSDSFLFFSLKLTKIAETTETWNNYDFNSTNVLMLRNKLLILQQCKKKKSNLPFWNSEGKKSKSTVFLICWKTFNFATCSRLFTSRVSPINFKQFN